MQTSQLYNYNILTVLTINPCAPSTYYFSINVKRLFYENKNIVKILMCQIYVPKHK